MEDIRIKYVADTSDIAKAERALAGLTAEEKKVIDEFKRMNSESSKAAKGVDDNFKKLNNTISNVGKALIASEIVGKVFDMGKAALKSAAEYEQLKVAFTTFLGSAEKADKVLSDLTRFADKTPYDTDQVYQAGKALIAFGISADSLIPTLTKIGDIASGTGKDFNELAVIYGKAKVAGTLYAEDINQLVEAGVPIIQEFAKQMGVSEGQVKKLASEGKIGFTQLETAFTNLTSEGGRFFNLMESQSATALGKFSTFESQLASIGRSFGEFLLPAAIATLDVLAQIGDAILKIQNPDYVEQNQAAASAAEDLVKAFGELEKSQVEAKINELTEANGKLKSSIEDIQERLVIAGKDESLLDSIFGGDEDLEKLKGRSEELSQQFRINAAAIDLLNGKIKENDDTITSQLGLLESLRAQLKTLKEAQEKAFSPGAIIQFGEQIDDVELKIKNLLEGLKDKSFFADIEKAFNDNLGGEGLFKLIDEKEFEKSAEAAKKTIQDLGKEIAKLRPSAPESQGTVDPEVEKEERIQAAKRATFDLSVDLANAMFEISSNRRQVEIEDLEIQKEKELALVGDNEQAKKFITEKFAREQAALKTKQAQQDKQQAIFSVVIDGLVAVGKAIAASPLTFGLPWSAFAAGQSVLQAGLIAARPIPKYKKGTEFVAGLDTGQDSILAMLRPGERVVPTEINRQLAGITNMELPKLARMKDFPRDESESTLQQEVVAMRGEMAGMHKSMKRLKVLQVNVDSKGVSTYMIEGNQTKEILNKQFSI